MSPTGADEPAALLGGLTPREFLERDWQVRPVLVRGALPDWRSPVGPNDLADLACRDDVESRLVLERGDRPWEIRHGPFEPEQLAELPEGGWTLLVHGLERHVVGAAELQASFRFVPGWRFDDVMASVAPPGGSVGPHVDAYDVFLVQAVGRRRWLRSDGRIPEGEERLLDDADARVLAAFRPDSDDVLEPGDLLYLPPGVPHHGVAVDVCVTLSIGFRAPDVRELAALVLGRLLEAPHGGPRYADPGLAPAARAGEITPEQLDRLLDLVRDGALAGPDGRRRIGAALTEPRGGAHGAETDAAALRRDLAGGRRLRRASAAALAWTRVPGNGGVVLFAAGEAHDLPDSAAGLAETLCGPGILDARSLAPWLADDRLASLIAELVTDGALIE